LASRLAIFRHEK